MNRRGFMGAILAAGVSPWVARAGVLMPVKPLVIVPTGMELMRVWEIGLQPYQQEIYKGMLIAARRLGKTEMSFEMMRWKWANLR